MFLTVFFLMERDCSFGWQSRVNGWHCNNNKYHIKLLRASPLKSVSSWSFSRQEPLSLSLSLSFPFWQTVSWHVVLHFTVSVSLVTAVSIFHNFSWTSISVFLLQFVVFHSHHISKRYLFYIWWCNTYNSFVLSWFLPSPVLFTVQTFSTLKSYTIF